MIVLGLDIWKRGDFQVVFALRLDGDGWRVDRQEPCQQVAQARL